MKVPFALSAASGLVAWLVVSAITGRKEAWDSSLYFVAAIPILCAVAFAIAWRFPQRAWLWAFGIALGQSIGLLFSGGSLSLWPLTVVAMSVLSLPQLAAALVASALSKKRAA